MGFDLSGLLLLPLLWTSQRELGTEMRLLMKIDFEALPHWMETPHDVFISLMSRTLAFSFFPPPLHTSPLYFIWWFLLLAGDLLHRGLFSVRKAYCHEYILQRSSLPQQKEEISPMVYPLLCCLFLVLLSLFSRHFSHCCLWLAAQGTSRLLLTKLCPMVYHHTHTDTHTQTL